MDDATRRPGFCGMHGYLRDQLHIPQMSGRAYAYLSLASDALQLQVLCVLPSIVVNQGCTGVWVMSIRLEHSEAHSKPRKCRHLVGGCKPKLKTMNILEQDALVSLPVLHEAS